MGRAPWRGVGALASQGAHRWHCRGLLGPGTSGRTQPRLPGHGGVHTSPQSSPPFSAGCVSRVCQNGAPCSLPRSWPPSRLPL